METTKPPSEIVVRSAFATMSCEHPVPVGAVGSFAPDYDEYVFHDVVDGDGISATVGRVFVERNPEMFATLHT